MEQQATRTHQFTAPSGYSYTVREQNGADDDIISNPLEAKSMMNISKFIAAIVVGTDRTEGGKLTPIQAHELPILDRYCILINTRIFSLGAEFKFVYDWGQDLGKMEYTQDLNEYLLNYGQEPSMQEIAEKPYAIPFYPLGSQDTVEITTINGKNLRYKTLNGEAEAKAANLPMDQVTRNASLIARSLEWQVEGTWVKVKNFQDFSVSEMNEIRKSVAMTDPTFEGIIEIPNPNGQIIKEHLVGLDGFFYPAGM